MARTPKAPGRNGEATLATLVDELESRAKGYSHDVYWRDRIMASSIGAIARLLGEATARGIAGYVVREPVNQAVALANLARGLTRRGDVDAARTALAEARGVIAADAIDGEHGTIAWNAVALAHHGLGDSDATELALDAAQAAAERDTVNPTQPWPHFAVALARTGRLARLGDFLRGIPSRDVSFDIARAAKMGIAQAVARGDVRAYQGFHDALLSDNAYALQEGIREGARSAIEGGHGSALLEVIERFCASRSYVDGVAADVSIQASLLGQHALGSGILALVAERLGAPNNTLALAFEALGDDAAAEAIRAGLPPAQRRPRRLDEAFGRVIEVMIARGAASADAVIDDALARGRADTAEGPAGLAHVAQGLLRAGRVAQAQALMAEALAAADAIPKKTHGWQRNQALQQIGTSAAAAGDWAVGLKALRLCGSKSAKAGMLSALAQMYARAGDFAGARMALAAVESNANKGLMNIADALLVLAGDEPQWANWS